METDAPETWDDTTPSFEIDGGDEFDPYLLSSRIEILAVLRALIEKKAMLAVHLDDRRSFFLTSVIGVAPGELGLIVDVANNEEMNRAALSARNLVLTAVLDKVKVQFRASRLRNIENEGRPAFLVPFPEKLLRLQRREFFRLATSIANPIRLCTTIRHPDLGVRSIDVPLSDISGGGVGLMVTLEQSRLFEKGDTLDECKIVLPTDVLIATLRVRNLFDVTARNGARLIRVGCEYVGLPPARLTVVQRFITRIERERKARLNGLA